MADGCVVRSAWFWRGLHRALPLGQRYNRTIRRTITPCRTLRIPWGPYALTLPAEWLDVPSSASAPIYKGPRDLNPEFFEVVAPLIEGLPSGTIVDVGANIGVYTLNLRVLSKLPIIAFEPEPMSFRLLTDTAEFNRLPAVSLRNVACGAAAGEAAFRTGINGSVFSSQTVQSEFTQPSPRANPGSAVPHLATVPVVRLDDELADAARISLIKIDCEGFELNVLKGCQSIIQRDRPILFVELHPKLIGAFGQSLEQVCDLLRPWYDLHFWDAEPRARSGNRLARLVGQYRQRLTRLTGEREMQRMAALQNGPDQLFLLALPKLR